MTRRLSILAALVAVMAPAAASAHGDRWRHPPPRYYGPPPAYLYEPKRYYEPPPWAYHMPPPPQPLYFERRPPLYYAPHGTVPPPYPYSGWTR